jgi:hypothetical protein
MSQVEIEIRLIIAKIKLYIEQCGGDYRNWYVGITSDLEERLFEGHKIRENDLHTSEKASNSDVARAVENHFINKLKTQGGPGGGDATAKFVYAYKVKSYTVDE